MKALVSNSPGGPQSLVLGEIPEPTPAEGEIRISVSACAVNYPDVLIIADRYQVRPPRPFSPGTEVAGVVDAIGADVTNFAVGQRVFGVILFGGMGPFDSNAAKSFTAQLKTECGPAGADVVARST